MKRQVATFLMIFFSIKSLLTGYSLQLNTSYDYFRGLPDGSWNGNNGAFIAANGSVSLFDFINVQLGGSYGLYNWDGRGSVVFGNTKKLEQIGFITAGASSFWCGWNGGLVYDRLFTDHFSIYDLNPSIDQIRFQGGYSFCSDELGAWGTLDLSRSHKRALGLPVSFKAIGQMNLFWSHIFQNCAKTTVWIGIPYRKSLKHPHGKAGNFITGFSFRAPLAANLYLDGNGSYMFARAAHGVAQSRNYASSICIGITYFFSDDAQCCESPYMTIANHSNFFVDTNVNQ